MLSVTWTALAQDRKITGSVQDAKGGGIPGVSGAVKGTTTGTTTDVNDVPFPPCLYRLSGLIVFLALTQW